MTRGAHADTPSGLRARLRRLPRERRLTLVGGAIFFTAFTAVTFRSGLQLNTPRAALWATVAVCCLGAANPRRVAFDLLVKWSPLFLALFAYARMRGQADSLTARSHLGPHLDFDRFIGFGQTPGERMQHALYTPGHPHVWDYLAWMTYSSHFILPLAIAVVLWRFAPRRFGPYMIGLATLSYAALATYAIYPAQPPWMASESHHLTNVVRIVHDMWGHVGIKRAATVFSTRHPGSHPYSNPVAALPSLHAAFPVLIFLTLRGIRRWLTVLLACYPVLMGWALVYAGEHYVFDVLMGWLYAVVVFGAVNFAYGWARVRVHARRRAREAATVPVRI